MAAIRQGHVDGKSFILNPSSKLKLIIKNRAVHTAALHCYPLPSLTVCYRIARQTSVRLSTGFRVSPSDRAHRLDQPWLLRYTKLLHNVMVSTFGSNRQSYQHILQFDTAVRNFPIIPKMDLSDCTGEQEGPLQPAEINIIRWLGVSNKESSE